MFSFVLPSTHIDLNDLSIEFTNYAQMLQGFIPKRNGKKKRS